jgi:NADPH2:quinone reductase
MVKEQGADYVLDHHDPACLERIMEITAGKGVDVILEMLANLNLGKDLPLLARGGRVVVIGSRGRVEIDPRDTMGRDASIMGMLLANATENELHTILAALFAGFSNGTLSPVVGKEIPLAEAPSAHIAAAAPGRYGKIVLTA